MKKIGKNSSNIYNIKFFSLKFMIILISLISLIVWSKYIKSNSCTAKSRFNQIKSVLTIFAWNHGHENMENPFFSMIEQNFMFVFHEIWLNVGILLMRKVDETFAYHKTLKKFKKYKPSKYRRWTINIYSYL